MTSCCVDKWTENALLTVLSKVCYRWSLCQEPCASSKEVRSSVFSPLYMELVY